jgi:hypothetical protein
LSAELGLLSFAISVLADLACFLHAEEFIHDGALLLPSVHAHANSLLIPCSEGISAQAT